jgi:hypothetical protein
VLRNMKMVVTVIGMIPLIFIACLLQSLGDEHYEKH